MTEPHADPIPGEPGEQLRRELYERVRTDDRIFEFLQAGSLDGIWYWDLEHPAHEWMSPRFWETFGYDPALRKHLASEWQTMIHPEDLELAQANANRHFEDPSHPYDQTVRYRGASGRTVWVRCRGIAVRNADGKPIRMLGAHTNVTALKEAEAELLQRNTALRAANEDLEALAFAASHDIRSPLRSLAGLLQILDEDHGPRLPDEGREVLRLAQGAVERLQRTAAGVVQFASVRQPSASFEEIDVATLVEDTLDDLRADIEAARAEVEVGAMPRVRAVRSAFSHVLSNLVGNALKFRCPAPGVPRIEIQARRERQGWTFRVSDNGPGIDPAQRDRVFQPFSRFGGSTDGAASGVGLGLAICKRCVELHGGQIWVDPDSAEGAAVCFHVPQSGGDV